MGKGEIARNEQFLLFPQCFLPVWITFCHFHQTQNCHLQTPSVWKRLKFVIWERVKYLTTADSVDQDQAAHFVQSDLDLHCNQRQI